MAVYLVDGERRVHYTAGVHPPRKRLVRPFERRLLDVYARLSYGLADVALVCGVCLYDCVFYDRYRHLVLLELPSLPSPVVYLCTFGVTFENYGLAVTLDGRCI